ncbi:hypothetical protein HK405_013438 [Cladochytrium tenue]|nr:hypothetical protein HK405_013438 [Cladochytrium tenue]
MNDVDVAVGNDDRDDHASSLSTHLSSPRFAAFDISWCVFKRVPLGDGSSRTHGIKAYVLVPKSATAASFAASSVTDAAAADASATAAPPPPPPPATLKVAVRFHGGGWTNSSGLYPAWFPRWLLDLAAKEGAAIVAPDYRMLPEARGADILDDVRDFWRWLAADDEHDVDGGGGGSRGLRAHVAAAHPGVELDLRRVIATGESAGGHLALHSGLMVGRWRHGVEGGGDGSRASAGFAGLRAVVAMYPGGVDPDAVGKMFADGGSAEAAAAAEVLAEHLRALPDGPVVSEAEPPARDAVWVAMKRAPAVFQSLFGARDDPIWLANRVRLAAAAAATAAVGGEGSQLLSSSLPPPQLVVHGEDDAIVPAESSVKYARLARAAWGPDCVDLVLRPGDHGFTADASAEQAAWLREKLEKVAAYWNG